MLIQSAPTTAEMPAQTAADSGPLSLDAVLAFMAPHGDSVLNMQSEQGMVQTGYHVTEVKAGRFASLDCGGNPDAWNETILQVEDAPLADDSRPMTAGKFARILAQVSAKVDLDGAARLTIEVGKAGQPMRVHDVAGLAATQGAVLVQLAPRPAICKPRHRTEFGVVPGEAAACCGPKATGAKCCG